MEVHEVRDLVRRGQVVKAPNYHGGRKGISFQAITVALERCYQVSKDERADERGDLLHPRGWFALANLPHRRRLRVEFDVHSDENGHLLLVVTAYNA